MLEAGVGPLPTCAATGKRRYPNWESADGDRRHLARRCGSSGPGLEVHAYPCEFCGGFHVGAGRKGQRR